MVHYLQDETTHRLNIDVIDLSNFIFICNETSFLEPTENHRVSRPLHHICSVRSHLALLCSPRPRSCKAPLLPLLPYNIAELCKSRGDYVSTVSYKRNSSEEGR
jgi:hypothetical protein